MKRHCAIEMNKVCNKTMIFHFIAELFEINLGTCIIVILSSLGHILCTFCFLL